MGVPEVAVLIELGKEFVRAVQGGTRPGDLVGANPGHSFPRVVRPIGDGLDDNIGKVLYDVADQFWLVTVGLEEQFQGLAKEKQSLIEIEFDEFNVLADRGRCKQILINLLGNALKFSSASNIRMRAKMIGETCRLEIEDNGCGMPKEDLARIFQAFIQAESATKSADGGTGLGLAISKKLAAAHDGDIHVESTIGAGTKFTVDLPNCAFIVEVEKARVAA
ncbi:hypothetical protein LCGC14_1937380 [marine sediment metagenome]|uniref:histidine kinase n=1 Tax=marine sediment metagenome TaxID=412755 RepID=A0A0F9IIP6_9ZZZZ